MKLCMALALHVSSVSGFEGVHACVQFMLTVFRRIITPFQVAKVNVQAYPRPVDLLAIIKCVRVPRALRCVCEGLLLFSIN